MESSSSLESSLVSASKPSLPTPVGASLLLLHVAIIVGSPTAMSESHACSAVDAMHRSTPHGVRTSVLRSSGLRTTKLRRSSSAVATPNRE
ncbi:hypothetical protein ASPFODRAFT_52494 [Aspergillus luchuensis CBS 106.47]|uniref:Uncharacterized protein n=1 Tax=Aspergillus luchuensis (strain CBS 106.47) TaxID=1137211 RepID=A0A1M3T251_ASPLC|nr:hypothetical protein ASPFODRAFT_52494 [Aspergillus luchuensis CBS 106.47]